MTIRNWPRKGAPVQIEHIAPDALVPDPTSPRRHSSKSQAKGTAIIAAYGFVCPAVIDDENRILDGHLRVEIARRVGLEKIPCIRLSHLSPAQRKAFALAVNRVGEDATWDPAALKRRLRDLVDVEFDMALTGFEEAEIDFHLDGAGGAVLGDPDDEIENPDPTAAVSQIGDLWRLGAHRLLCADAREEAAYERLLGDDRARMVFADPPYNVPVNGHVSGLGRRRHREFPVASGELSEAEFGQFLTNFMAPAKAFSQDGALHYICIDWRNVRTLLNAAAPIYSEIKNIAVWVKSNAGMGSYYRSQHEFVVVAKCGRGPHRNNIELGRYGRSRSNVWDYPGAASFGRTRDSLDHHPTPKAVALVADAIRDCTKRGDVVLDPFMGSGTTIIAAERTGRQAAGIELDPLYVDVAVRRWESLSGKRAVLEGDGRSFAKVAAERAESSAESAGNALQSPPETLALTHSGDEEEGAQ